MFFNLEIYSIRKFLMDRSKNSEAQRLLKESMTGLKGNNLSAFEKISLLLSYQKSRDTVSK